MPTDQPLSHIVYNNDYEYRVDVVTDRSFQRLSEFKFEKLTKIKVEIEFDVNEKAVYD